MVLTKGNVEQRVDTVHKLTPSSDIFYDGLAEQVRSRFYNFIEKETQD